MINLEMFLLGLLITSTFTGLATEAVKNILQERAIKYYSNTLVGLIGTIISAAIGSGYILVTNIGFTTQTVISLIALIFISWLCAMVGYDKVVQAIGQFKVYGKNGDK